jgi:hypothetical protein
MANTGSLRFWWNNLAESATLKNGTGGAAPADDEVSPWIMENAQNKDRTFVWQQSAGAGTTNHDLDLGSDQSIGFFAMLGHRGAPSTAVGVASSSVKYETAATGYVPGSLSTAGSITVGSGVRDAYLLLSNNVIGRYVRNAITATTAFTLGRWFIASKTPDLDLGVISSPGRDRVLVKPILENEVGSNPTKTRVGDNHYSLTLPYNDIGATLVASLRTLAARDDSFVMIDYDGNIFEAMLEGDTMSERLTFDLPEMFDVTLRIRTLG